MRAIILAVLVLCAGLAEANVRHYRAETTTSCTEFYDADGDNLIGTADPDCSKAAAMADTEDAYSGWAIEAGDTRYTSHYELITDATSPTGEYLKKTGSSLGKAGEIYFTGGTGDKLWVVARNSQQPAWFWVTPTTQTDSPSNAIASFVPATLTTWTPVLIGQVADSAAVYNCLNGLSACGNTTGQRDFGVAASFYIKHSAGIEIAYFYRSSDGNAEPSLPAGDPEPTAHYEILKCESGVSCPTAVDSSAWDEANSWNFIGNNTSGITDHVRKWLHDGTFFYTLDTFSIASISAGTTANDSSAIFSDDRVETQIRLGSAQVTRDTDTIRAVVNCNSSGGVWDANFPDGAASTAYSASVTRIVDFPTGQCRVYQKFRFASVTLTDDTFLRTEFFIQDQSVGVRYGYGNDINNLQALVKISGTAISGVDSTAPTPGVPDCDNAVTENSFTCLFTTNETGTPKVRIGLVSKTYTETFTGSQCSANCSVLVTGRTAGSKWFVVADVTDAAGNTGTSSEVNQTTTAATCNFYVSNTGSGSTFSSGSPGNLDGIWAKGSSQLQGTVTCMKDGEYKGSAHVIDPPQGLNGTSTGKITIRAENDGAVTINGEAVRQPVRLTNNDHFILQGFDAHNSSSVVVQLGPGADNNTIRRVCAWDAEAGNSLNSVFLSNSNTGNLLEDICAFGRGRGMIGNQQNGNNYALRRAWARYERNDSISPKTVYSLGYNSINSIAENVIGNWDTAVGANTSQQYAFFRYAGVTTVPVGDPRRCQNNAFLGSIAYIKTADVVSSLLGVLNTSNDSYCNTYKDVAVFIEPGTHTSLRPAWLRNDTLAGGGINKFLTNFTEIGGASSTIESQWQISNRVDVSSISAMNSAGANPFQDTAGAGARVCFRYVDGVLTSTPLWPWPMDSRIRAALTASGRDPDTILGGTDNGVTEQMEAIFGTIPAECRS